MVAKGSGGGGGGGAGFESVGLCCCCFLCLPLDFLNWPLVMLARGGSRSVAFREARIFARHALLCRSCGSAGVRRSSLRMIVAMEPQAKIRKLHDNGKVELDSQALRVKKLSPCAVLPSRGSALAAGYDLSSAYDTCVPARGKALVKTELSIAIPQGTYARIAPRSGLAWKNSIDVGAGVIDADYRGPVGVILFNHSDSDFTIKAGDRIAQLILELIVTPDVMEVDDLDATARGEGGFGSTGVSLIVQS